MSELLFTSAAVLDLLTQIDELSDKRIDVSENGESGLTINIGDSSYKIDASDAEVIDVSEDVVDQVAEVADEAYDELENSGEVELSDDIEGGLVSEAVKSLLLGGMIRLSSKLLK